MSEIKTCEEYVLSELMKAQKDVDTLNNHIKFIHSVLERKNAEIEALGKILEIKKCYAADYKGGMEYYHFYGSVWADEKEFEEITGLIKDFGYVVTEENERATEE